MMLNTTPMQKLPIAKATVDTFVAIERPSMSVSPTAHIGGFLSTYCGRTVAPCMKASVAGV
jgi:hypothetical protein